MTTHLPLLAERRKALETCAYCPKLCRAYCPVSNADRRETLTPWGKMSASWLAARGTVPLDPQLAEVAWACTGCMACREHCDHENPVAETLADARADFTEQGLAPAVLRGFRGRFDERQRTCVVASRGLRALPGVRDDAPTGLLIGCEGLLGDATVSQDIVKTAVALVGDVRLLDVCCGLPLLMAGDRPGYLEQRQAMADSLAGVARLVVADPACARLLSERTPELLLSIAHRELRSLGRAPSLEGQRVRWHDPCHLGRGLGLYDEPRAILMRALGRAPEEFARFRDQAECSGGGGLLPLTAPETSARIAQARILDGESQGGGVIVTGCATSRRRFQASGARVVDLHSVIRESLSL